MIMITKKRLIAGILSVMTAISMSGSAFAFLDDVDDVPVKDIMAEESTAGEFSGENIIEAYCSDEENHNYVAVINYGNGHYNILGTFSSDDEFLEILNGIYFKNM